MHYIAFTVVFGALVGVACAALIAWYIPRDIDRFSRLVIGLVLAPILALVMAVLALFAMSAGMR